MCDRVGAGRIRWNPPPTGAQLARSTIGEVAAEPSRNQIRKAASLARDFWIDPDTYGSDDEGYDADVAEAFAVLYEYRAGFQRPLDKVTIQLRRFVGYETDQAFVAQRLKRMPTIMGKLERHPTMDITRMQDIGGCRAVLPDAAAVDAVLARIGGHWKVQRVFDYVTNPKPSGYRAVHASVLRDDRLIEIQLRTPGQQAWAAGVERVGARLRMSVKDGEGPEPLLRWFEMLARVVALEEAGEPVDDELMEEIDRLDEQVRAALGRTE